MNSSYDMCSDVVVSLHKKSENKLDGNPTAPTFYSSTMELLNLLSWFQRKSNGCYASTSWLSNKLHVKPRALLQTLSKLQSAGYIDRLRDGRRRIIIVTIDGFSALLRPLCKPKSAVPKRPNVHTSTSILRAEIHNTAIATLDVVVNALIAIGLAPTCSRVMAKRYGSDRINAVITHARCKKPKNMPGYIITALTKHWVLESQRSSGNEPPLYPIYNGPAAPGDFSGYAMGIDIIRQRLGITRSRKITTT